MVDTDNNSVEAHCSICPAAAPNRASSRLTLSRRFHSVPAGRFCGELYRGNETWKRMEADSETTVGQVLSR